MPTAERALLHRGGRAGTWGSLGLWAEGDDDYADACAALATAVGRAAGVSRGDRVLSVACGAGDELRLWVQGFGAAQVTGIERDRGLVVAAWRSFNGLAAVVDVRSGSGTDMLSLGLAAGSFDHVLCVDAAYHLRPRESFLQHAFLMLRPGGRLAYTDLCLDPGARPLGPAVLRGAARLCSLPVQDLLAVTAQTTRLQALGFESVSASRLDDAVLGGFARYVRQQSRRIARTLMHRDWRWPGLTARLIGPCRAAGLGYVLLSATRGNDSASARAVRGDATCGAASAAAAS